MRAARRVRPTPDLAWLRTEKFGHEPIYCDAQSSSRAGADDVLLSGSDDEYYNSPAERRLRIEEQAHRYIEGKPLNILSAALHGPFDRESGWTNPWRSRSRSVPTQSHGKKRKGKIQESPRPSKRTRAAAPKAKAAKEKVRNETTTGRDLYPARQASSMVVPCSSFQYLEDEVATRVIDWAESIVIETQDHGALLGNDNGDDSSNSDDGTPSSALVDAGDDTAVPLSILSPTNSASGSPNLNPMHLPTELQRSSMSDTEPSQPTTQRPPDSPSEPILDLRQEGPSETPRTSTNKGFIPLDITDLSPLAVRAYEEQMRHSHISPLQDTVTPTQGTAIAAVAAALSSAQGVTDAGYHTFSDRSFRFKSKKQLGRKSIRKSRLNVADAEPPRTEDKVCEDYVESVTDDVTPSEQLAIEERIVKSVVGSPAPHDVVPCESQPPQHEIAASKDCEHSPVEGMIVQNTDQQPQANQALQVLLLDEADESDVSAAPSVKAPQLASVGSPLVKSVASNLMSLGTFSWEKEQSQSSFLVELPGMPRKLLWPRSQQKDAAHAPSDSISLPPFDWAEPNSSSSDIQTPRARAQPQSEEPGSAPAQSTPPCFGDHSTTMAALPSEHTTSSQKADVAPLEAEDQEETTSSHVVSLGSFVGPQSCHSQSSSPIVQLGSPLKPGDYISANGSPTIQLGSPMKQTDLAPDNTRPVVELGSPIKPLDRVFEDAEPAVGLGSPLKMAGTVSEYEESSWPKAAARNSQTLENTGNTADVEAPESVLESSKSQSPWAGNVERTTLAVMATPAARPQPLSIIGSQSFKKKDEQSPWARGDSQVTAIAHPRLFNPLSSPAISPGLPKAADLPFPSPRPLPQEDTEMVYSPRLPSTPTRYNSSLPTPEFTLSIKSFREFMTPSPVKQRTPLGPADSNGRLPSTQVLADAAASNPWARPSSRNKIRKKPKKAKRVSWGPLPGEEPASSPTGAEFPADISPPGHSRPASPPPSCLIAPEQIPAENEKFGKHFAAAVAKQRQQGGLARRRSSGVTGTPLARPLRRGVSLLPSASQQVCDSPAADAMAEAFIQADAGVRVCSEGLEAAREALVSEGLDGLGYAGNPEDDKGDEEMSDEEVETQKTVDDVNDVLDNLDDFLDRWDVDAELAKARAESEKKEREIREAQGGRVAPSAQKIDISLMDAGIWD
ncbi:hypothetical protein B0T14DRAFT_493192 [Immersiella caudata]|uniref:Protamine P1 n=1 Tax=Immersiella caudata TaxID=314043 RepID=A0AA39X541_9PEZI|nr:hypothetical protein B0T14DRAFT_493192 [Immersiella caudata]